MLPERVTAWIAPICDSRVEDDLGFWRDQPYEIDLSLMSKLTANEVRYCQHHITEDKLLAEPQEMWTTDTYTCSVEEARSPFKASLLFAVTREGGLNALATWFHAEFGEGIVLTNSPGAPKTHWGRFVYPLNRTIIVEQGAKVMVEFACEPMVGNHCHSRCSIKVGDCEWEHHQSVN